MTVVWPSGLPKESEQGLDDGFSGGCYMTYLSTEARCQLLEIAYSLVFVSISILGFGVDGNVNRDDFD
jgi:hypothetical protein